jgi:hypothetical protein
MRKIVLGMAALALASCGELNSSKSDDGPTTCEQSCQDRGMAVGVNNTIWFLYNQNIAGTPSGAVNKTNIQCPLGGTASITGSASAASNGISTVTLTYTLAACGNSGPTYSITLTGDVKMAGSFKSSESTTVTMSSDTLTIDGTVKSAQQPKVIQSCPVTVSQQVSGSSNTLKGTMCGREFYYSSS